MNVIRTAFLMATMTAIFVGLGGMLGGEAGLVLAFLVAGAMNFAAYWNSDKMVLRMHGAEEVNEQTAPDLVRMVRQLAIRADLPMPRVYIMRNAQPNAFATGRNPQNAAVAATTGLLQRLAPDEIEGVMAHELAHIKNRDTLLMTLTATLAGAISMLANFALFFGNNRNNPLGLVGTILVMILAPIAATLVQMAISRTREYSADKVGAEISGKPQSLANALMRISDSRGIENRVADANPSTAHLFISNPLKGVGLEGLFSTHPPMAERVRRLESMETVAKPYTNRGFASGQSGIPVSGRPPAKRKKGPWG